MKTIKTLNRWMIAGLVAMPGFTYAQGAGHVGGPENQSVADRGFTCTTQDWANTIFVFSWLSNGDFVLVKNKVPNAQREYGFQHSQIGNNLKEAALNLKQFLARFIDGDVITEVLARGNSMSLLDPEAGGTDRRIRNLHHEIDGEEFTISTRSKIEKIPAVDDRAYSEFPMYLDLWNDFGMKKKSQHETYSMICSGSLSRSELYFLPLREIFAQPAINVYRRNYIIKYDLNSRDD